MLVSAQLSFPATSPNMFYQKLWEVILAYETFIPLHPNMQYAFSPHCSLNIFKGADKENLFAN